MQGGTTISRLGIKKLTGAAVNTQRARERRLATGVQQNIAELVLPRASIDPVMATRRIVRSFDSRRCPDFSPTAFQIRNTYYSVGTPVTHLLESYSVCDAVPARLQPVLQPEYGVQSLRQTFNFIPELETVRDLLAKNVAIDVAVGYFCHPLTGERYGRWLRFEPSVECTDADLLAGLNYAAQLLEQIAVD
jgi:hypothetical protein